MRTKKLLGLMIAASLCLVGCGGGPKANPADPNRLEKALTFGPETNTMGNAIPTAENTQMPMQFNDQGPGTSLLNNAPNPSEPNLSEFNGAGTGGGVFDGGEIPAMDSTTMQSEEVPAFPQGGLGTDPNQSSYEDFTRMGSGSGGVNDGAETENRPEIEPLPPVEVDPATGKTLEELERIDELDRIFNPPLG